MTGEPLDIDEIESHPRVPRVAVGQPVVATAPAINRALDERDALLAEVKRLRAQVANAAAAAKALHEAAPAALADVWDDGYRHGYSIGVRDDPTALTNYENPYRQPKD